MSVAINGAGSITGIDQGFNVTTGSVGIGTDNPGHILDVYNSVGSDCLRLNVNGSASGSNKQNAIRFSVDGDVKAHMGLAVDAGRLISGSIANDFCLKGLGSNNILFATNSSERLRITSGGNVGVGDDNPDVPFNVKAGGASFAGQTTHAKIEDTTSLAANVGGLLALEGVYNGSGDPAAFAMIHGGKENATDGNYAGYLRFLTRPSNALPQERLRITSGGNVGIKNTSPNNNLTVGDGVQTSYAPPGGGNYIEIARTSGADAGLLINKNTGQWLVGIDNSDGANAPLRFEYGAAGSAHPGFGAGTLGMLMKHNGNVGIGTDNPQVPLHVFGNTRVRVGTDQVFSVTSTAGVTQLQGINEAADTFQPLDIAGSIVTLSPNSSEALRITSGGDIGINETSPDTTLHISKSAAQSDTHGILKVESTNTGTGAQANASLIVKNRYGWSQFMQWEDNGLRIGSRSTSTGGEGKVTVTYGSDNTGAVINENGVVTMPQQCGFHVVLHTSQTLVNNQMVNLWDTDASDSRSYIKNMTFNAGRFVAPVAGLYYFTSQLLLSGVASSDDNIHIMWTKGSNNDTFTYWNTRHDGASANGNYGYGGYLPVTGSTTVYLSANEIFGIKANFTGGIGVHGSDANWGHWSGFLVG